MTLKWEQADDFLALKYRLLESDFKQLISNKVSEEDQFFYFCGKVIEAISDELYEDILTIEQSVITTFRSSLNCMSRELRQRIRSDDGDINKKKDVKKCIDAAYFELSHAEKVFNSSRSNLKALLSGRAHLDDALQHLDFYLALIDGI